MSSSPYDDNAVVLDQIRGGPPAAALVVVAITIVPVAVAYVVWLALRATDVWDKVLQDQHLQGNWSWPTFLFLATFYVVWWSTYFLLRSLAASKHLASLRVLLSNTSDLWDGHRLEDAEGRDQILAAYQRKASSGISAVSSIIACCTFVLGVTVNLVRANVTGLPFCCLLASAGCGLLAIPTLLVTADALDTSLNHFASAVWTNELVPFFYRHAVKRRYVGLASFYAQLLFAAAALHPGLGSAAVILILNAGYDYWFIRDEKTVELVLRRGCTVGGLAVVIALAIVDQMSLP